MQSERRYKIDKYLEMARITRNEFKKDHFLDLAENYLETEDIDTLSESDDTAEWLSDKTKEDFFKLSVSDMYEDYLAYAKTNGIRIQSKRFISRRIKETFHLEKKVFKVDGKSTTCYH